MPSYPEGTPVITEGSTVARGTKGAMQVGTGGGWDYLEPSTNNYVLMLDSSSENGVKWAAAGAASAIQAKYILQSADENYTNAQALDVLGGGMLMANNTGVIGIASPGTQYYAPGGSIAIADLASVATHTVLANTTSGSAAPGAVTLSSLIDAAFTGTQQGNILCRGSTGWKVLAPGTSGYVLSTQSTGGFDPQWVAQSSLSSVAAGDVVSNITLSSAIPIGNTLSDTIDAALTASAQGTILFRGASGWEALAPGTNTYVLATQGASANPHWVAPAVGGSGASTANTYIVQTTASDCSNAQVLASLSTGLVKVTGTTGVLSTAEAGTDYAAAAGGSGIVTVGTISTGTWNGTAVGVAYGGTGLATLTAHGVMLGEGTSAPGFATIGTAGRVLVDQGSGNDPAFASTGLTIAQWGGPFGTVTASSGAATINLATFSRWQVTLDNGDNTLTISNPVLGSSILILIQPASGAAGTITTWPASVDWGTAGAPTLTSTNGKADVIALLCVSTSGPNYWGMIAGQGF